MTPFFSIVTACKDGLSYLRETIPLVVNQSYGNWEWLIVDDGSDPSLREACGPIADERIRWIRKDRSEGQTKALNLAIRQARGEWIVRLDGDDLPSLDRLAKTYEAIQRDGNNGRPGLAFGDYDVIEEDGRFLGSVRFRRPLDLSRFLGYLKDRNNPICHPAAAFRRIGPDALPYLYDENLRNAQDYELWKRILLRDSGQVIHVAHPILRYRLVRSSLSGKRAEEQKEELRVIREGGMSQVSTASRELSDTQSEGMYAFRKIFYHLISARREAVPFGETFSWLRRSLGYPAVSGRALAFWLGTFLRPVVKRLFFANLYE